jgi:hypothetical protein
MPLLRNRYRVIQPIGRGGFGRTYHHNLFSLDIQVVFVLLLSMLMEKPLLVAAKTKQLGYGISTLKNVLGKYLDSILPQLILLPLVLMEKFLLVVVQIKQSNCGV